MVNNHDENQKKGLSTVTAGLVGAGVGVAVGTAAAVLADKNTREKLVQKAKDVRDKVDEFKVKGEKMRDQIVSKSKELNAKYQPVARKAKKAIGKTSKS